MLKAYVVTVLMVFQTFFLTPAGAVDISELGCGVYHIHGKISKNDGLYYLEYLPPTEYRLRKNRKFRLYGDAKFIYGKLDN